MTYTTATSANLSSTHQANLLTLLTRRLEVAKARHDEPLVHALEREYAQITTLASPAAKRSSVPSSVLRNQLARVWMRFSETLSDWTKVHIQQTVDANGQPSWHAYNPQAGLAFTTTSQDELRQWLKRTYWEQ